MVMFDERYIKTLMDIGENDARARIGEISALLTSSAGRFSNTIHKANF
jgi:Mn-dependent DtxR family transcriptional regulator